MYNAEGMRRIESFTDSQQNGCFSLHDVCTVYVSVLYGELLQGNLRLFVIKSVI